MKVIFNGELKPAKEAAVPVTSRGLMYGDGCFETFCAYKGKFFKLNEHLDRFKSGLDFLSLPQPKSLKAKQKLKKLLAANELLKKDAAVRIQVWRKGGRGYKTEIPDEANYTITASCYTKPDTACELAGVKVKRIPSASLPAKYKLSNSINYIIAAKQASHKDADDALLQTVNGAVSETTTANIFWLKNETVYTPSLDCDILPGITRAAVIEILRGKFKNEVREGTFSVEAVKNADAVWICNSLKEIQPVNRIDAIQFEIELAFLNNLQRAFKEYRDNRLQSIK